MSFSRIITGSFLLSSILFQSCEQGEPKAPVKIAKSKAITIPKGLENKTILGDNYPKLIRFRGEYHKSARQGYEEWAKDNEHYSAVIRKYGREELTRIAPETFECSGGRVLIW